tara:strand:+ start:706 stop:846 length:141 start_codon:yes stop_codon:yes gene_type:complete
MSIAAYPGGYGNEAAVAIGALGLATLKTQKHPWMTKNTSIAITRNI